MYALSRYVVEQAVQKCDTNENITLLFSTRSSALVSINSNAWETAKQSNFKSLSTKVAEDLFDKKFLIRDETDELAVILSENMEFINNSTNLYFPIQPTAACPFGCNYCGQSHSSKSMSDDVQNGVVQRIKHRLNEKRYSTLTIGWFGAEPLSGMKAIDSLSPRFQSLAQSLDVEYSAKIVTNGLLLSQEIAKRLVEQHKVSTFEITLDGIEDYHDKRRFLKTGGPSFNKIYQNICSLLSIEPTPTLIIRSNVDTTNFEGISPLIQKLARDNLTKKINMYVAPIHSWGNDAHKSSAEKQTFAEWEIDWLIEMEQSGIPVSYLPTRKKAVCFAVRPDAELIDPFGGIYGCSEVSLVPFYEKEGKNIHEIGNVLHNKLLNPERRDLFGNFYSKQEVEKYDCASCVMLPTCGGACPKEWKEGRVPCPSTKFNIKQRMILQYIKYGLNNENIEESCLVNSCT